MGMMLRRNGRKNAEYTPSVNGKPVVKEPKKKKLTQNGKGEQGVPQYDPFKNLK
jgi:hypothetical protein